jgi:hypothetical protein
VLQPLTETQNQNLSIFKLLYQKRQEKQKNKLFKTEKVSLEIVKKKIPFKQPMKLKQIISWLKK